MEYRETDETIEHLFALCPITKRIIDALKTWEPLQIESMQFGLQGLLIWEERMLRLEETFCNVVNILVKHYIWVCRREPKLPFIRQAKAYIRFNAKIISRLLNRAGKPDPFSALAEAELGDEEVRVIVID